jgi:hypothetical protein
LDAERGVKSGTKYSIYRLSTWPFSFSADESQHNRKQSNKKSYNIILRFRLIINVDKMNICLDDEKNNRHNHEKELSLISDSSKKVFKLGDDSWFIQMLV